MIRRPPRSTQSRSSAASDVYKRQVLCCIAPYCTVARSIAQYHRVLCSVVQHCAVLYSIVQRRNVLCSLTAPHRTAKYCPVLRSLVQCCPHCFVPSQNCTMSSSCLCCCCCCCCYRWRQRWCCVVLHVRAAVRMCGALFVSMCYAAKNMVWVCALPYKSKNTLKSCVRAAAGMCGACLVHVRCKHGAA